MVRSRPARRGLLARKAASHHDFLWRFARPRAPRHRAQPASGRDGATRRHRNPSTVYRERPSAMIVVSSARQRGQRLLLRAASLMLLAAPAIARAEPSCSARTDARDNRSWPAPLDRVVSLHGRDLALREALDRLATAAR